MLYLSALTQRHLKCTPSTFRKRFDTIYRLKECACNIIVFGVGWNYLSC